jgi:hypothetical protein
VDLGQPIDFVVSCDKVNNTAVLVPSAGMLVANELRNLLVSLEAAYPGSCKEISSILSQKATFCKIKKVKEYLKSKSKKEWRRKEGPHSWLMGGFSYFGVEILILATLLIAYPGSAVG